MESIKSIKIKLWLPVFFASSLLIYLLIHFSYGLQKKLEQLDINSREAVNSLLLQNALPIRRAFETSRSDDIQIILGSLSLSSDLDAIAVTDEDMHILFSSHYAWTGEKLSQFIPESNLLNINDEHQAKLRETSNGLVGMLPIKYNLIFEGKRQSKLSALWIVYNTQREKDSILKKSLRMAIWELIITSLFVAIIIWILFQYLGRPMIQLSAYVRGIASGNYKEELNVKGKGEIAQLVNDMHLMNANINQAITNLKESEQRLSITLDSIGDAVIVTDSQGLVTRLNSEAERLTGWKQQEAIGNPVIKIFRILNTESGEPAEHPVGRVLREGRVIGLANHTTLISKELRKYQIADSAAPIFSYGENRILGVIMVFQDVTGRYKLESELKNTLNRLKALTVALPDPCFVLNKEGEYIEVLGGPPELLARSRESLIGRKISEVLPQNKAELIMETIDKTLETGQSQNLEYSLDVPAGEIFFEGVTTRLIHDDEPFIIWLARDITRRKKAEDNLTRLAKFDSLTGLLNRSLMLDRLNQSLARTKRSHTYGALLFIDLDRFKDVNDSLGHQQGDELLVNIAERIRKTIRTEDIAARFGGDEFVVLLEELGNNLIQASEHAESIAEKLRETCAMSIDLTGHIIHVELSMGVVLFPNNSSPEELLQHADLAMYNAKESGRNRICFFSKDLQEISDNRLHIQHDLRKAIDRDELKLYVQPRVNAQGKWISGEILVRWQHPEKGLLQPNSFIPIAEQSNLIADLDNRVVSRAIEQLSKTVSSLPDGFEGISINLSEPLMMRRGFVDQLKGLLMKDAVEADLLEFEITERILLSDYIGASEVMEELRRVGIRFSVDDFGTGCSSLRYLQRLPLDNLKIDKSFVDRLPSHSGDASIVETIIDMAHNLSMTLVAEGVETKQQYEFLADKGCEEFQGFLFSRPVPWDEFFSTLNANS